jgi:hypothetical protein
MDSKKPYFNNLEDFLSWEIRQAFWTLVHNRGVDNVVPPKPPVGRKVRSKGISWMDSWKYDQPQYDAPRKSYKKEAAKKLEASEYRKDHRLLRDMLEDASKAGEKFGGIERLDKEGGGITSCTPIARDSFVKWVFTNQNKIFPLRHFPDNEDDLLLELMDNFCDKKNGFPESKIGKEKTTSNKGGNPGVDPDGKIAAKIKELKLDGVAACDIPWEIRFSKFVQNLKKDKIKPEYFNTKVPRRAKKADYTDVVGISLDTVKKLIKETP